MINSYCHNSSAMSTEDGSSSVTYGAPQPVRSSAPYSPSPQQHHHQHSHRQPLRDYVPNSDAAVLSSPKPKRTAVAAAVDTYSNRHREAAEPVSAARHCFADADRTSPVPSVRTQRADSSAAQQKALTEASPALLEVVLPVSTKLPSQEAQVRPLGVYVRAGRGGVNGVTRLVLVRLTDPTDPFFLYELELLEDDYGVFKQRLELLVDFQGFPRYLVSMLRDIADGASPYELSFVLNGSSTAAAMTADAGRGTLRVLETTEFKTVEHISLLLMRQGDAGLKKYLAERFQFYEHSFRSSEAARTAVAAELQDRVDQLEKENHDLRGSLRKGEDEMRFMTTDAEKEQLAALNRLRDQHAKETNALRESYEKKLETHARALEEKTQQLRDTTAEKDTTVAQLRTRTSDLEGTVASLQSQLRTAQDTSSMQVKELDTLRELNEELASFKAEATKAMSENELNYVTLTERLRGTSTALQNREERVAALQEHYEKQDAYIRILAEQNKQQADRVQEAEKNLEKAHHIIANQLQTIKSAKDRYHIAADQLRSQEALLHEREGSLRRQQDEVATANERIQELLRKNNDLRDQLEKTNNAREQLVQEVKQCQQALLRLQQSTSINGRHWGVLGPSAYRGSSTQAGVSAATGIPMSPSLTGTGLDSRYGVSHGVSGGGSSSNQAFPADLMHEFSANANTMGQGGYRGLHNLDAYRTPGVGGADVTVAPRTASASLFTAATAGAHVETEPPVRHYGPSSASPSPAHSSQDRAGSSETAGATESHGRTSTSSLGRTEPSSSAALQNRAANGADRRAAPLVKSVPLDKPSAVRPAVVGAKDLAGKCFFPSDAAPSQESAYF